MSQQHHHNEAIDTELNRASELLEDSLTMNKCSPSARNIKSVRRSVGRSETDKGEVVDEEESWNMYLVCHRLIM